MQFRREAVLHLMSNDIYRGSAVLVSPDRVITTKHQLRRPPKVTHVATADFSEWREIDKRYSHQSLDLGVITLTSHFLFEPLEFNLHTHVQDLVVLAGYPAMTNHEYLEMNATLSKLSERRMEYTFEPELNTYRGGMSGGAVVDEDGRLVGMNKSLKGKNLWIIDWLIPFSATRIGIPASAILSFLTHIR